ncbi:MAG: TonB-dependent receptor [Magnetococcus sp. YQC-5]
MKKKFLAFQIIANCTCGTLPALADTKVNLNESVSNNKTSKNDAELAMAQELRWVQAELTATLEAYTDLATKTTLNADQVPGMVTVLRGKDLEAQGIRTVLDALTLIPGMSASFHNPTVRGIEGTTSGKIKYLVNDMPFNATLTARNTPPYALPIEMIDRIEMIRGPGSALYGEFASVGVINIVTRKEGKRVYARAGSDAFLAGGGLYSGAIHKDLTASLHLTGFKQEGQEIHHDQDILHSMFGQPAISNAPGKETSHEKQRAGVLTVQYKDFSLLGQYMRLETGAGVGTASALPPADHRLVWNESQWGVEAKQEWKHSQAFQATFKLGVTDYAMTMDKNTLFPPGFFSAAPAEQDMVDPNFPLSFAHFHPDGVVASTFAEERRIYGIVDTTLRKWDHHIINMALEWADIKLVDVQTEGNTKSSNDMSAASWKSFDSSNTYIKSGVGRRITGVMLQDQVAITDRFDLTAGLRFDHYDDVGTALTPRLALVYRVTDQHILKAQYGNSFRPPTFFEMYANNYILSGNPQIKPEIVDTYELGYIYRDSKSVARTTLFYSDIRDYINNDATGKYINSSGIILKGVELELEKTLSDAFKVNGNLSYVTTHDKLTGSEVGGSANWMGHAGLVYQPMQDYALAVHYRYMGQRNRVPGDVRPKLDSIQTFNLTGSRFNLVQKGVTLRANVNNVFNATVTDPDPTVAYPKDFPRPGRSVMMSLIYDF